MSTDENIPNYWEIMPANTPCHTVALAAGTAEYQKVQDVFQATCKQTVISVESSSNAPAVKRLRCNNEPFMFLRSIASRTRCCGRLCRCIKVTWIRRTAIRTTRRLSSMAPPRKLYPSSISVVLTGAMLERTVRSLDHSSFTVSKILNAKKKNDSKYLRK